MSLSKHDLTLIGASLYLCEGTNSRTDKNGKNYFAVEFTNKDPRSVKLFLRFLREVVLAEENRIKAELFIYPEHDEDKLVGFWSKVTKIPLDRFNKTIKLKQQNARYKPNPLGTMKIRYTHKEHFLKIQGIIGRIFG